jgi:predicted enzyme related to lactoylglutathione lyase
VRVRRIVPDFQSPDPRAGTVFYVDVIGLEVQMDLGWVVTVGSTSNETAQLILMREDATAPVVPDATIEVEDVDAVHARAVAAGCEVVHALTDEPWGVRRFFVRDPGGKVINVMTHRDDSP